MNVHPSKTSYAQMPNLSNYRSALSLHEPSGRLRSTQAQHSLAGSAIAVMGHSRARAALPNGPDKVKTVEVHHLVPGSDEVLDNLSVRVRARVNLRQRAELGI